MPDATNETWHVSDDRSAVEFDIDKYARWLYENVAGRVNWDTQVHATHYTYRRFAEHLLATVGNDIAEKLSFPADEPAGYSQSNAASTAQAASHNEYDPERIFRRVDAVRKNRTAQYNNTRVTGHQELGTVWTTILNAWLRKYGIRIPTIPGWVVALLLSALKLLRVAISPNVTDSYDDAINYIAITEECAVMEGELDGLL